MDKRLKFIIAKKSIYNSPTYYNTDLDVHLHSYTGEVFKSVKKTNRDFILVNIYDNDITIKQYANRKCVLVEYSYTGLLNIFESIYGLLETSDIYSTLHLDKFSTNDDLLNLSKIHIVKEYHVMSSNITFVVNIVDDKYNVSPLSTNKSYTYTYNQLINPYHFNTKFNTGKLFKIGGTLRGIYKLEFYNNQDTVVVSHIIRITHIKTNRITL